MVQNFNSFVSAYIEKTNLDPWDQEVVQKVVEGQYPTHNASVASLLHESSRRGWEAREVRMHVVLILGLAEV